MPTKFSDLYLMYMNQDTFYKTTNATSARNSATSISAFLTVISKFTRHFRRGQQWRLPGENGSL
ncbi:uncharacterized protein LOC143264299 isoform X3 [Megachile rotundata]|uniref:uncharacterized protein LOC143264299 isoform X3 n=1 Tax=Megachile rotundata TaxID=143995 RepID=UPI003FD6AA7C